MITVEPPKKPVETIAKKGKREIMVNAIKGGVKAESYSKQDSNDYTNLKLFQKIDGLWPGDKI